jgi:hypothetical protein
MSSGPGYYDEHGLWMHGDADLATVNGTFSDVLNKGTKSMALAVPTLVTGALAPAAEDAIETAAEQAGVVLGARAGTEAAGDIAGGLVGENGRTTDFVFDDEGRAMDSVLHEWAARQVARLRELGLLGGVIRGVSSRGAGGLVGENGRETDIIFDADGRIIEPTIVEWAGRMSPYIVPQPQHLERLYPPAREGVLVGGPPAGPRLAVSSAFVLVADGDSMTQGWPLAEFPPGAGLDWPARFKTRWPAGTVINGGKAGQSADEVALRQGGYALEVSVTGGSIPASGAVIVTTTQKYAWRLDRAWTCLVDIAGVQGTLSRAGAVLTFTRTANGDAVPVPGKVRVVSRQPEANPDAIHVIFAGRNDIGYASDAGDVVTRVVASYAAQVGALAPAHPRFVIIPPLTTTSETRGTAGHTTVAAIETRLAQLYPANTLDLRHYLATQAIYDLGITPTSDDLAKIAGDTLPASLMVAGDNTHYKPATADAVAAQVHTFTNSKGWLA